MIPGTVTPQGAVVGRKPGERISSGIVCIRRDQVGKAKRHGWAVLSSWWANWWHGKAMVERN